MFFTATDFVPKCGGPFIILFANCLLKFGPEFFDFFAYSHFAASTLRHFANMAFTALMQSSTTPP